MSRLSFVPVAVCAVAVAAQAQGDVSVPVTALPLLEVPAVVAMGGANVGRTDADPRLGLQNPAAFGMMARDVAQAVGGTPTATWYGENRYGASAAMWGLRRGSLAAGVAIAQATLRGADRTLGDGTPFAPADRFRSLSLGVATTGAVRGGVGVTGRYVTATDVPVWTGATYQTGRLRGASLDLGAQVQADVAALAGRPTLGALTPALEITAGYAQTNLSGAIRYSGFANQPLPRTASAGWSLQAGLELPVAGGTLRLVDAEASFSAERSLVRQGDGTTSYAALTNGLGAANVAFGTGGTATTGRRGVRLTLAETLALSTGRFDGWGYEDVQTRGWEVRTAGLSRLLSGRVPFAPILARTDLRVGRSTVWAGTDEAASRTTLTLVVTR